MLGRLGLRRYSAKARSGRNFESLIDRKFVGQLPCCTILITNMSNLIIKTNWICSNRTCIDPERQLIFGPFGLPAAAARLNSDCCSLHVLLIGNEVDPPLSQVRESQSVAVETGDPSNNGLLRYTIDEASIVQWAKHRCMRSEVTTLMFTFVSSVRKGGTAAFHVDNPSSMIQTNGTHTRMHTCRDTHIGCDTMIGGLKAIVNSMMDT